MSKPWTERMPDEQFERMKEIIAAPSPVGLEAAMTRGVIEPLFKGFMPENWSPTWFKSNAGLVFDTHPGQDDMFTVMLVGHTDKIRMQVRSVDKDGKIWVNTDSFLPGVLVGHEVIIFAANPDSPGSHKMIKGGTIEALGAIHFAKPAVRSGENGIKSEMIYVELHLHGEKRKEQVEKLGIRPGDSIIFDRPIKRGFAPDSFYGAYLDNGLGCFVVEEIARLLAEKGGLNNIRCQFAFSTHEEIGRMGSRVMAGIMKPDVLIGVDVGHDYEAAPGVSAKRFSPVTMGKGFIVSVGAVASNAINAMLEEVAKTNDIPIQYDVVGRDTGTDAMAAVFASIDAAVASVGFPTRNMHTISEAAHTGDVLASIYALKGMLEHMDQMNDGKGCTSEDLKNAHPRLDLSPIQGWVAPDSEES